MEKTIKIDFVSDVTCGWCAVALNSLEQALRAAAGPDVKAEIHFHAFELNPDMPQDGENLLDHLKHKYGEQAAFNYFTATRLYGSEVGFPFKLNEHSRIYNTFIAHRLLHWAGLRGQEQQTKLKHALFHAHFTENKDPGDIDVLLECAEKAELDIIEAAQILNSDAYSADVRGAESEWLSKGVHAVPTIVINDRYEIVGARPVDMIEKALRSVIEQPTELPVATREGAAE
jgi:predicted DsbA family dithiol-disulfide isomerase